VGEIDGSGEEQLTYYCDYIRKKEPQWWKDDAVPILWSVVEGCGEHSGFDSETAPCLANISSFGLDEHCLTFYPKIINLKTGEPINWFKLPVRNYRFPKFAEALSWLPAPFQSHAPLRSIMRGIEVLPRPVQRQIANRQATIAD
jgi:hypothetical protein